MSVGLKGKGEYDPRGHIPWAKITKNQYAYLWHKGKPAILAEGGGNHNHEERWPPPWPPYLYKTLIESEYLTKNKQLWININRK